MEDGDREQPSISEKNTSGVGRVRVVCRPAPDAEERLRRLFTLLVKHATKDKGLPPEA